MLKIKFKPPPHKKYLIFDEHHSDQIKQIIKEKKITLKYCILDLRN